MELIAAISLQEYDVSTFINSTDSSQKTGVKTGCFIVSSCYFSKNSWTNWTALLSQFQFSAEEKNNTLKKHIFTLSQFWRSRKICPAKIKSKYIARPELAYISGIHFVHKFIYSVKITNVSSSTAVVHHYRSATINNAVLDTGILRFKNQLYPRVMDKYKLSSRIFS